MPLTTEFAGQALPLYGSLVLVDPNVEVEDSDGGRAMSAAISEYVAASRYRVYIHAAQDSARISVRIQLWTTEPDVPPAGEWDGQRLVDAEFPQGQLILENISAGAVDLLPGPVERLNLPGGAGQYRIKVWFRHRDTAATRVQQIWEQFRTSPESLAEYDAIRGLEEYTIQIWPH
jgi:hypothetical protein